MIKSFETASLAVFELKLNEIGEKNIISIVVRKNGFVVFYKERSKNSKSKAE